jgi:isoleucyl-tRNA synthetase
LTFKEQDIVNIVISDFFRALENTYKFLAMYANIDGFTYEEDRIPVGERTELDRWILSVLNSTLKEYTRRLDNLDPSRAMRLVQEFTVDLLSNWYVRRNRRRFWKGDLTEDKIAAYQTLYECLITVAKMMAPLAPFISDRIYQVLNETTHRDEEVSVHLALLTEVDEDAIDEALERRMKNAQTVVTLALSLREQAGQSVDKRLRKVRQPLRRLLVAVANDGERDEYVKVEEIIRDELNVKSVEYVGSDATSEIVQVSAKPNFKSIGPRFGKDAKRVAAAISSIDAKGIRSLNDTGSLVVESDGDTFEIEPDDIEIIHDDIPGWMAAVEGTITVAIDTELDDDLLKEGLAREFVNRVQKARKESGLDVTDRIRLLYSGGIRLNEAVQSQEEYIQRETLATEISSDVPDDAFSVMIEDEECLIALEKVNGS